MVQHIRKFKKRCLAVSFFKRKQKEQITNLLNDYEIPVFLSKSKKSYILFCFRLRFSFIMLKNYTVPMQNLSTSPKKTDLNSEKTRLENRPQMQPNAATLQKILQFASAYRAERISENQYVEWVLN